MATNTGVTRTRWISRRWLTFILTLLLIGSLLAACGQRGTPSSTEAPSGHSQITSGEKLPEGAEPCKQTSSTSLGYAYSCPVEQTGYTINLANVPDGVTPYLVPISDTDRDTYQGLPKDNFNCPISIAGNLVFGDDKSGELVKVFKGPIELKLGYDPKAIPECKTGENEKAVPVPVFLYSFAQEAGTFQVWKPFENYSDESSTMSVQFKTWGDPPIGVSLYSAPINWGPP